jgi:hypothetical protein
MFPILILTLTLIIVLGTPFVIERMARMNFFGNRIAIAALIFVPGFWCAWILLQMVVLSSRPNYGRAALYYLLGEGAFVFLIVVAVVTTPYLLASSASRQISLKNAQRRDEVLQAPSIFKPCLSIFLFLLVATAYLYNYETLEDAVKSNDVDLTRRRLQFNLLGRGPNDGGSYKYSNPGVQSYPLLPIAVWHDNMELVDLLLVHGAELNPEDWDSSTYDNDGWGEDGGDISRNILYYAVREERMPMLVHLLNKGADPSRGITAAVSYDRLEILAYLLRRGADRGIAREALKEQRKNLGVLEGNYRSDPERFGESFHRRKIRVERLGAVLKNTLVSGGEG